MLRCIAYMNLRGLDYVNLGTPPISDFDPNLGAFEIDTHIPANVDVVQGPLNIYLTIFSQNKGDIMNVIVATTV